jgi:exopolysaccharide biosynthesis predicted pyruvyltransferase EpsI
MKIDIKEFLQPYKDIPFGYVPNDGNVGDSLIAYSTTQLFKELGLDFHYLNFTESYNRQTIIYGGGGNLIGMYPGSLDAFLRRNMHLNDIVLLPHTIKDEDKLIYDLPENVTVICREEKSYNYVVSLRPQGKTYISQDMAFYLKTEPQLIGTGTLNAFRIDDEKTDIEIPQDNCDLSEYFRVADCTSNPESISKCSNQFLDKLAQYETVNTNRLHVAIAGALLGLTVNMHPNSYWKNEEVYKYSLSKYPNVNWNRL